MLKLFRPARPYSVEETEIQLANLDKLNKLRDSSLQKSVLYKDKAGKSYQDEVKRYDEAIEASQEVYNFMNDEIIRWQKKVGK